MIGRRAFLSSLGLAASGLVLDPERLLWVPGQKTWFLPPMVPSATLVVPEWIVREVARSFHQQLTFSILVSRAYESQAMAGAYVRRYDIVTPRSYDIVTPRSYDGWSHEEGLNVGDIVTFPR